MKDVRYNMTNLELVLNMLQKPPQLKYPINANRKV